MNKCISIRRRMPLLPVLSAALAAKDEALQDARKNRDRLQGVTANLRAALPERERLRSAAETERDADLQAAGFADLADWEAALAPVGTMDGEAWLEQRRQKQEAYRHELESLRERLGELADPWDKGSARRRCALCRRQSLPGCCAGPGAGKWPEGPGGQEGCVS